MNNEYKILFPTFKTKFLKNNMMPVYLKDLIDKYKCPQNTRLSKDEFLLVVPKTKMPTVGDSLMLQQDYGILYLMTFEQ